MWNWGETSRLGVSSLPRLTWHVKGTRLSAEVMPSLGRLSRLPCFALAFRWVRDDWHYLRGCYSSTSGVEYVAALHESTPLTDDINNHRSDPEQWCCKNSWVQRFTDGCFCTVQMFWLYPRAISCLHGTNVSGNFCENNKYYVRYIMCGKRALLQRKLRSSKCAAAIGLPGGLWEMAYMGMPSSAFWQ